MTLNTAYKVSRARRIRLPLKHFLFTLGPYSKTESLAFGKVSQSNRSKTILFSLILVSLNRYSALTFQWYNRSQKGDIAMPCC